MKQMVFELKTAKENINKLDLEIEIIKKKILMHEEKYFEKRKKEELEKMQQNKENIAENIQIN